MKSLDFGTQGSLSMKANMQSINSILWNARKRQWHNSNLPLRPLIIWFKICMKVIILIVANQNNLNLHEFSPVNSLEYTMLSKKLAIIVTLYYFQGQKNWHVTLLVKSFWEEREINHIPHSNLMSGTLLHWSKVYSAPHLPQNDGIVYSVN